MDITTLLADGIFTITPVRERSCIAVRIPMTATQAMVGVKWYNNDDQTPFENILVASGLNEVPPLYDDGLVVAHDVTGARTDWSELQFDQPIASNTEALYLIFQLAENVEGVGEAEGPGIGYVQSDDASCVFLSSDGSDWARLKTGFKLLIEPILVSKKGSMVALSMAKPTPDATSTQEIPKVTQLGAPYPNPFNPQVNISYDLAKSADVDLRVFDVRGQLVSELVHGPHSPGQYVVQWYGKDQQGARVASGVYFVKFQAGGQEDTRRLVMVK